MNYKRVVRPKCALRRERGFWKGWGFVVSQSWEKTPRSGPDSCWICVEAPQMLWYVSAIVGLRLSWVAAALLAVEWEGGFRGGVWLAPGESQQLHRREAGSGCEARPVARQLGIRNLVSCSCTDSACGLWVTAYDDSVSQTWHGDNDPRYFVRGIN